MTPLAAYLLLFLAVGVGFIFVHLVAGKLVRPSKANPEKETIYECGEPTIGSAWVQFDLRFYVVALLFEIFDVEVAFFFPWAEIFGKSNAIRAAAEPKSVSDLNEFAAKVNDLSSPGGSVSGPPLTPGVLNATRERELWRKLETMSREEFDAYTQLKGDLTKAMRQLGEKGHESLRSLTEGQLAVVKEQAAKLDALFKDITDRQKAAARQTLEAVEQLPEEQRKAFNKAVAPGPPPGVAIAPGASGPPGLPDFSTMLKTQPDQVVRALRTRPMAELSQVTRTDTYLLPLQQGQEKAFQATLPERAKALRDLADAQAGEIAAAATAARKALTAAGDAPPAVWDTFSPRLLIEFSGLSKEKLQTFRALTPVGLVALETPMARDVKAQANTLAWLALVEILVFFGVLLVGFAYLWRRGDLAWVRSTAAEEQPAKV